MENPIAYSGWIGHRNIGDEALYLAVQSLFPDYQFSDVDHLSEYDILVYGGGTIFPDYVSRGSDHTKADLRVAIGVGVGDPRFWNQRFGPTDIGNHLGQLSNKSAFDSRHLRKLFHKLNVAYDSQRSYNKYLSDYDFEILKREHIEHLGVRGPISSKILSRYGIEHEIVGDTALALEPSSYIRTPQHKIAVTLRNNTYGWGTNEDYHSTIIDFCRRNSDTYEFVFLPFWPPDIDICRRAADEVPNASFYDDCTFINVHQTIDRIAGCDLMIGDKLHANILSACTYTPFISLEYRTKNRDFAESVNMGEFNIRTDTVTVADLEQLSERLLKSDDVVQQLEENVGRKRTLLSKFADRVTEDIHQAY